MIPYQQLRTNHLFSGAGDNPLGITPVQTPNYRDPINEYLTRIKPVEDQERMSAHLQQIADENRHRAQARQDQVDAAAHPNVVYNPGINPLQKANIDLKQQAEQGKNDRANAALDEKDKSGQAADKLKAGDQNIRQQRADVYAFKATHPNLKFDEQKGGNIIALDPFTGRGMDTGFNTGTLSEEDKINLGIKGKLQEIAATGDQNRQTQTQRAGDNINAIQERGNQTRLTNSEKPAKSSTAKVQSESDKKVGYYNSAMKLASDPGYSKFIIPGQSPNTFSISPDTPIDIQHQIGEKIYGNPAAVDKDLPADDNSSEDDALKVLDSNNNPSKYKVSIQ